MIQDLEQGMTKLEAENQQLLQRMRRLLTEKQTALTDAAAAKKLGPERMYLNVSSCCEMFIAKFHCVTNCEVWFNLRYEISEESS